MRPTRFRWLSVCLTISCGFAARDASAQLVSSLVQPIVNTVANVTCPLTALPTSPRLDAALQKWAREGGAGDRRVIASAEPGLLGVVRNLLAALGVAPLADLDGINALVANVDAAGLSTLACSTAVSSISLDAIVAPTSEAGADASYSLRATLALPSNAPAGDGIGVAIVDSGIADVADLRGRISSFYDFTNGTRTAAPSDDYGHGTHVAGLIAAAGASPAGAAYRGVAPAVRLIGMKVLDASGGGRTSDVIRAVEYATKYRSLLGIHVINLSLGHPIYEAASRDPLVRAVEAASRAGVVVVAAAGNYGRNRESGEVGYGGIASPGNAPSAITVGSLMTVDTISRRDDDVAPYSSRGPAWYDGHAKPDLVAPGHGLVSLNAAGSTLDTRYPDRRVGGSHLRLNGTSMAAAVASGAVALVLEAHRRAHPRDPALTPNAVKAMLQYSSVPVREPSGAERDALTQGAGALNVAGAMTIARSVDTRRWTGQYWWTTPVIASTAIDGVSLAWSERVIWDSRVVLGPSVDTNERAWAINRQWGSATTWTPHVAEGADVVWDPNHQIWPTQNVWDTPVSSSWDEDHIVWGTTDDDHIVWGTNDDDHIVWGTSETP